MLLSVDYYGGCSSMAERETVALETRVRFTPSAFQIL
jgi:hypothetical protein